MGFFDRLFGTKKAAPAAQPKEKPPVPAERPQSQSATASTAHAELNRTLKQLEVKLQQEGNPALPIITLRVGEAFGQTVIRWHYVNGYGATSVLLDSDRATKWLTKELSPFGIKIVKRGFTDGSRERGSPERCFVWSVEMQKSANPCATTLPGAVEASDKRMADLQIHCSLPEAAKHLAPSQIDELVQAMVSCTWDGAYSKVEGVRSKLGDHLVSNTSAQSYGSAGVIFKISVPADQGIEAGQAIQSVWDEMQKFIQQPISGIASSPIQGVHLFLLKYRDGAYDSGTESPSNVKFNVVYGDEANNRARAVRSVDFSEGNEYMSVLVLLDAPVASFENLRVHGTAYCARCNQPVTFVCDCVRSNVGDNSQLCPRCEKPIHISAGTLAPDDEKCSELWLLAGMTDHPKAEPITSMAVNCVRQLVAKS
jgi:hypothetical protein